MTILQLRCQSIDALLRSFGPIRFKVCKSGPQLSDESDQASIFI